jgi:hypothetical protein
MIYPNVDNLLARASVEIASALCRWDEVPGNEEPDTLDAAVEYFRRNGRIAVTRKAEFGDGRERLWGSAEPWQAFFVWHDWCHINTPGGTFDPAGEAVVHARQMEQLYGWVRIQSERISKYALDRMEAVIASHNIARLEYWRVAGNPPDNLRDFTNGYLASRSLMEEVR